MNSGLTTAPHPVEVPHGLDSPVARVYDLGGKVLLLGLGHDANTTVHRDEYHAGLRFRREKVVTDQLRRDETTFLHPPGIDDERDEARASLTMARH